MTRVNSTTLSEAFQPPPHHLTDEELDRIALTVPILITRYDTQARCIYISPDSERFTAKPPSWFIGRSLKDYHNYPIEFISANRHSIERILETGESQTFEISLEKPSGVRRRIHHQCPQFDENGSVISIVSFSIDITDKHNAQLQLERTVEEQSSFHAMLAHELRNPLVSLLSGLQTLDRAPPPEVAQRVRQIMHKEITHITRLIEDLLDTARVETGALTYRRRSCTVEECLNFGINLVQPIIKKRGTTVKR